jgi:hypothetical protein
VTQRERRERDVTLLPTASAVVSARLIGVVVARARLLFTSVHVPVSSSLEARFRKLPF